MEIIKQITAGISEILYPRVCVCCGVENTIQERHICSFCLAGRFEDANPGNDRASSDTLLPNEVLFQHSLWRFDKGGDLQNLLHYLKYQRLTTIGHDLGKALALRIQKHSTILNVLQNEPAVILPVPLHYVKFRYRGFNQAFEIAAGFQDIFCELPICGIKEVVRLKNTRTQTGFSLEKRLDNVSEAFRIKNKDAISDKICIIIDDVFTTGATTFELAKTVAESGAKGAIILAVAQA